MKIENSININRPVQAVWDYLNEPDNLPKWLDNFERYERLTGDPKNPKPGDKGRHTYKEKGREFTMDEEMLIHEPPHHVKLILTSSWFDLEIENTLEAVDDSTTKLTASADMVRVGFLMKFMKLMGKMKDQEVEHKKQLAKLKELIEAEG